ncbi:hypothetical protein MRX96_041947 [Rhipicephalus microplus]
MTAPVFSMTSPNGDVTSSSSSRVANVSGVVVRNRTKRGSSSTVPIILMLLCLGMAAVVFFIAVIGRGSGRTELICTVGDTAVERKMFPPDGLCHYLYYTHVFVATIVDDRPVTSHYVRATRITASFDAFKDALKRYKKTEGGLSFDIK